MPLHDLTPDDGKREPIRLDDAGTVSHDEDEQKTRLSTGQWIETSYIKPSRLIC